MEERIGRRMIGGGKVKARAAPAGKEEDESTARASAGWLSCHPCILWQRTIEPGWDERERSQRWTTEGSGGRTKENGLYMRLDQPIDLT